MQYQAETPSYIDEMTVSFERFLWRRTMLLTGTMLACGLIPVWVVRLG